MAKPLVTMCVEFDGDMELTINRIFGTKIASFFFERILLYKLIQSRHEKNAAKLLDEVAKVDTA